MSTKIQINSLEALERLIGNDNELEIQVRNSIVQEFTYKHLKAIANSDLIQLAVKAIHEEIKLEFFTNVKVGAFGGIKTVFKEEYLKPLREDLRIEAKTVFKEVIAEVVEEQKTLVNIQERLQVASTDIADRLTDIVLTNKLDKLVDAKIKEKLNLS